MNHTGIKCCIFSFLVAMVFAFFAPCTNAQVGPVLHFGFDNDLKSANAQFIGQEYTFVNGIDGPSLSLDSNKGFAHLKLEGVPLDGSNDFSLQCWVRTTSKTPEVLLSQKDFDNKGITAQQHKGWALYTSGGTFAWSLGSGDARITYERDNGEIMAINDGEWHQITIAYSRELSEFRLYYDGQNRAVYHIDFDFSNKLPLIMGTPRNDFDYDQGYLPEIVEGRGQLQAFVNAFNNMGLEPLKSGEFIDFISNTEKIFEQKLERSKGARGKYGKEDLSRALALREKLLSNPYTVYQVKELTLLKPISKIYALKEGKVVINDSVAKSFTAGEKLYPADFAMDELSIWNRAISAEEVMESYGKYRKGTPYDLAGNLKDLTVGVWNIWHGGIHWSLKEDGWDSRLRIVEMIKRKHIDVVLMQETYSSGDFIAAELGYYFGTTSDLDYRYQGSNISVLSRYPIKEIKVLGQTGFNNVAVRLAIGKTQEIWAMSNWYGMGQFPAVFDFHRSRFANSGEIPVIFGGDFNAVPHTDGGDSPASKKMLEEGFTDAFRSVYPDVEKYPGPTHRSGSRIDQLYYKGKGLKNSFTEVVSSWPTGFPSDHFLIVSKFKLDYGSGR